MKRHRTFHSLSREHHEGLLLAARLQQGDKALLKLWSHDRAWQAEFVVKFFDDRLTSHFEVEEQFLFPLAQSFLVNNRAMIARLRDEHVQMREMAKVLRNADRTKLEVTLTRFGEVLERHIRCEERELFPACEENIPADKLETLGRMISPQPRGH